MSGCFRRPTLLVLALAAASLAARPAAAQVSLVPARHPVYEWLRYQRVAGNAPDYVHEALPLSRKEVTGILLEIDARRDRLTASDQTVLDTYLQEFSLESLKASAEDNYIRGEGSFVERLWKNPVDQKEPHLYAETGDGYAYAVDIWRGRALTLVREGEEDYRTAFGDLGFRGYAEIGDHVGLHLEAGNAGVSIDRRGILLDPLYGKTQDALDSTQTSSFFVEAHATLSFKALSLDLGHGAFQLGPAERNPILISTDASSSDWIRLRFKTDHFRYTAMHGSLDSPASEGKLVLGEDTVRARFAANRWLGLHRFTIVPTNWMEASFSEAVVYSSRPADYAYLNPLNFFFFSQDNRGDRDNVLWAFDLVMRPVRGVEVFGAVLADDLGSISDLWAPDEGRSNQDRAFDVGLDVSPGWGVSAAARYTRIEPFVYAHWTGLNAFEQKGFSLGHPLGPNADRRAISIRKWLPHRTILRAEYARARKGLNPVDESGQVLRDVGGDYLQQSVSLGNRFLEGADVQEYNEITVEGLIKPLRGIELRFRFQNRSMKVGTRMADRRILDFRAKLFTPLAPVLAYLVPEF